ncbi:MAG: LamG domain-containing protein, partial [Bacteroidota bacterium]
MKILLRTLLCCCLCWQWGMAQNLSMCFERNAEDFIQTLTSGTPIDGNPTNFTVEMWLTNRDQTLNQFRRVFSLGSPGTRYEVGVQAGQVRFFSTAGAGTNLGAITANIWTHLAVVKTANQVDVYIDCVLTGSVTLTTPNFNFNYFRVGRWPGGSASDADWDGEVDDVRVWSTARTATEICNAQNCPLSCQESDLVLNWTFDNDGAVPSGNNTGLTQALDCSANANHGDISNFTLVSTCSNWINSTSPLVFPALHGLNLEIRDYPYRNNLLTGICDGEPVHFCLDDNGVTPGPYNNVTVAWEYSDDAGATWLPLVSPPFTDFCFPIQPNVIQVPCAGNADGFVDRSYRAISTVMGSNGDLCEYVSNEYDLQICCPIGGANPTVVPSGPLCEGDVVDLQVDLNPNDPWVSTPGPNVTIDWCFIDPATGPVALPAYANQTSFLFQNWTAPFPPGGTPGNYCFEAKVSNCQGKQSNFQACFTVDPQPVCGTIEGSPLGSPQNLTLINSSPLVYEICPGNDAILEIATPFLYCIPQWQYSFTPN